MRSPLIVAHRGGTTVSFERAEDFTGSCFGGPLEVPVEGVAPPVFLHHVAWLGRENLRRLRLAGGAEDLPLVHPLRHSGGVLSYAYSNDGLKVEDLRPATPETAWPYAGYPDLLPYFPLDVSASIAEDWNAFVRRAPNLPSAQPAELVVLVPPPRDIGFSLWGRAGDAEGVTLVFACDLAARTVRTFNVCG